MARRPLNRAPITLIPSTSGYFRWGRLIPFHQLHIIAITLHLFTESSFDFFYDVLNTSRLPTTMRTILSTASLSLLVLFSVSACRTSVQFNGTEPPEEPDTVVITTLFKDGAGGWHAGFSDYPIADADIYELSGEIASLPNNQQETAYYLAGHNRSDDLFMFLKYRTDQLEANTRYLITGEVTFLSNAGVGCFGVGGAPGEAVYVKMGASEDEPEQVDYYLNIDKGNQSTSGNDALVIGNIAAEGAGCGEENRFGEKTLTLEAEHNFVVQSSATGHLWLLFGTDSGFEGKTELYIKSIEMTLLPD